MAETQLSSIEQTIIEAQAIEVLRTCYDPEIPVNIYEMGLIYQIKISDEGEIEVKMSLTSPNCPAIQSLPSEVQEKLKTIPGVKDARVIVVWDPPWDPGRMSEAAKLELGMF
jgi:FeS assembly SUF system protein